MSSQVEPPSFQEAARCDICKCSFNTFRRRHHCRCCGRTLCFEHSSNQMELPQFGIHTPVRVCADCYNNSSKPVTNVSQTPAGVDEVSDSVLGLNLDGDSKRVPVAEHPPAPGIPECKCGMPLCICEAPAAPTNVSPQQSIPVAAPLNPRPKKAESVPKAKGPTANSKNSLVFNASQEINSASEKPKMDYVVNGEGLREAIKNDDAAAVRKLLREGVDANYCDKQGMSLLHLQCLTVFNRADIAFILMDSGANLDSRNAQGETPLDCAAATLQYKMRKRMEESN